MSRRIGPLEVLTSAKSFGSRYVGSPSLNRAGLHVARMAASDVAFASRRALRGTMPTDVLAREGIVVFSRFLPDATFAQVREEVDARLALTRTEAPYPSSQTSGFGRPIAFAGGFDRHDGQALNRFLEVDSLRMPVTTDAVAHTLAPVVANLGGVRPAPGKFMVQELLHAPEDGDIQKVLHRDTFHQAVKAWLFLEDVPLENGPLVYVRGSHLLTRSRAIWEYRRSLAGSAPSSTNRTGAFRITEEEIRELGLPAPESFAVSANTLVVANIRGFHRRGDVTGGIARRVAIHGSFRPSAFVPVPY